MTHTRYEGLEAWWLVRVWRGKYIKIYVWSCAERMWEVVGDKGGEYYGYAVLGHYVVSVSGRRRFGKKIGEIHLIKDGYGARHVAHEIMHIVNYWVSAKGWEWERDDERIAGMVGEMHRGFWKGHYAVFSEVTNG